MYFVLLLDNIRSVMAGWEGGNCHLLHFGHWKIVGKSLRPKIFVSKVSSAILLAKM